MARQDGRIEPGQPLRGAISARAWNRMMDAADIVHGERYSMSASGPQAGDKPYTWVLCKPSFTVARWGVVAITGVDLSPSDTVDSPVVTGGTPSATTTAWGVAVEPIESGKIGRLAVGGVVQLKASDLGKAPGAHVLWKDSSWALIRLQAGVIRGTFTGTWNKNGTTTVTDANYPTQTYANVKNYFGSVTANGSQQCEIAYVGSEWILVATDIPAIKRGTFTAPWSKGASTTVADAISSGVTYSNVKNYFANVSGSGSKNCAIAYVGTEWILIAAEC